MVADCEIVENEDGFVIDIRMGCPGESLTVLYGFFVRDVTILARSRWSARPKNAQIDKNEWYFRILAILYWRSIKATRSLVFGAAKLQPLQQILICKSLA